MTTNLVQRRLNSIATLVALVALLLVLEPAMGLQALLGITPNASQGESFPDEADDEEAVEAGLVLSGHRPTVTRSVVRLPVVAARPLPHHPATLRCDVYRPSPGSLGFALRC